MGSDLLKKKIGHHTCIPGPLPCFKHEKNAFFEINFRTFNKHPENLNNFFQTYVQQVTYRNRSGLMTCTMGSTGHGGDAKRSLEVHHQIRQNLLHSYAFRRADHESLIECTSGCLPVRYSGSKCGVGVHERIFKAFKGVTYRKLSVLHGIMSIGMPTTDRNRYGVIGTRGHGGDAKR